MLFRSEPGKAEYRTQASLLEPPEGASVLKAPGSRNLRGVQVRTTSFGLGGSGRVERAVVKLGPDQILGVDALFLEDAPAAWDDIATRIAVEAKVAP